jgi:virulence-associated protein VapD
MSDVIFTSPPHYCNVAIETVHRYITNNLIELNPKYQRRIVWSQKQQELLINSIWTNMYIQPVIVNVNRETNQWICVDGKQRLTSIKLFFDSQIAVPIAGIAVYYKTIPPGSFKFSRIMTPSEVFAIEQKLVNFVKYDDISPEMEKHIFNVIQYGVALSRSEKLNAVDTPAMAFVKELKIKYYEPNLSNIVSDLRCDELMVFARIVMEVNNSTGDISKYFKKTTTEMLPPCKERAEKIAGRLSALCCKRYGGVVQMTILIIIINLFLDDDDETILVTMDEIVTSLRATHKQVTTRWVAAARKMLMV